MKLWGKFQLAEEEECAILGDAVGDEIIQNRGLSCLLGKVLSLPRINLSALASTMQSVWRLPAECRPRIVGDDLVLFQFPDPVERNRVLQGSPWTFDKRLLVLTKYDGELPLGQVVFDQCEFWVQAFNLPLNKMHKDTAELLAN